MRQCQFHGGFFVSDVLNSLLKELANGKTVALATVVDSIKSAPRPPGASMLVTSNLEVVGSVSGGCVEGAVYELAEEVITGGKATVQRYGFSDAEAFEVGLTCGGIIDIFVERFTPEALVALREVAEDIAHDRPVAVATVISHGDESVVGRRIFVRPDGFTGSTGDRLTDEIIVAKSAALLELGENSIIEIEDAGEWADVSARVFIMTNRPRPRMIIFGAIDFASALTVQAKLLGYRVAVCDARPVFATPARFPAADEVVVAWPHRYLADELAAGRVDGRTALCVLTHDSKFDVPLLELALQLDGEVRPGYIGAMGSRRTHNDRNLRLLDAGVPEEQLGRLSSPIGLDLGGRTPEETAVSIMAEVIADRYGGSGQRLSKTDVAIHRRTDSAVEYSRGTNR